MSKSQKHSATQVNTLGDLTLTRLAPNVVWYLIAVCQSSTLLNVKLPAIKSLCPPKYFVLKCRCTLIKPLWKSSLS